MRFLFPHILWLLLLLPFLAFLKGRSGRAASLTYSTATLIRRIGVPSKSVAGRLLFFLKLIALGLLIMALARPQFGRGTTEIEASGIDIVLAVDISGSMEALDLTLNGNTANRIDVVKSVIKNFIQERPSDRIALQAFAGRPYLVSPLTLDHDWLILNLDRLRTGMVEDGTAVGSAIIAAVNRLRDQKAKSKIVILLTDGVKGKSVTPGKSPLKPPPRRHAPSALKCTPLAWALRGWLRSPSETLSATGSWHKCASTSTSRPCKKSLISLEQSFSAQQTLMRSSVSMIKSTNLRKPKSK